MNNLTFIPLQKYKTQIIVLLALAIIIFISGYLHIFSLGLYGDDWGASTYIFQPNFHMAVTAWWHAGSGEISNFRLLAVIIPILWYGTFHLFGLAGIIALNFLCYLLLAWIFFILIKQHVSVPVAFLSTVVFALYPTNNAYLWQVTLSYTLALICILSAVYFFYKSKTFLCIVFLLAGLFINEGTFFVFALALLSPGLMSIAEFKSNLKKWLLIVGSIILGYIALRVGLELKGVTGGTRTLYSLQHFGLVSYIWQFILGTGVVLIISWAVALWKIIHFFHWLNLLVGILIFAGVVGFGNWLQRGLNVQKITTPGLIMLAGLILVCAGRYYGFYFVPSINVLNLDSRYYFASSVGGAVFFAGLFEYLSLKLKQYPKIIWTFVCLPVMLLAASRFSVQSDYAQSWVHGQKIWQGILRVLPFVKPGGLLYVNIPHQVLGKPVVEFEAVADLRVLVPMLGRTDIAAISSPFINNFQITPSSVCFNTPVQKEPSCFDRSKSVGLNWQNGELVQNFGNLGINSTPLSVPQNFYKIIEQHN